MVEKLVQYGRKTHRCINSGNVYTCSTPAVCPLKIETPDCPDVIMGHHTTAVDH
jgi:hypothetical protein